MLPSEIRQTVFTKAVRGYKEEEVDELIDKICSDLSALLDENNDLKLQVEELKTTIEEQEKKIEGYKAQENAMLGTLEAAKSLMNDISASAEKRADILIKNAELDAELKQRQARDAVQKLKEEELALSEKINATRSRFRTMLENELARFDSLTEELFPYSEEEPDLAGLGFDSQDDTVSFLEQLDEAAKASNLNKTLTNYRRP